MKGFELFYAFDLFYLDLRIRFRSLQQISNLEELWLLFSIITVPTKYTNLLILSKSHRDLGFIAIYILKKFKYNNTIYRLERNKICLNF